MSLPKWITHAVNQTQRERDLYEAIIIAFAVLEWIEGNGSATGHWKGDGHCGACMAEVCTGFMNRIEELVQ